MSDQEKNEQQKLHEEQVMLVRASLIKSVFEKYHPLMDIIKKLPLPQVLPGLQKALLDIDSGILWIKELLNTAPLIFSPPQKKEEAPKEENQLSEPREDSESKPENSIPEIEPQPSVN